MGIVGREGQCAFLFLSLSATLLDIILLLEEAETFNELEEERAVERHWRGLGGSLSSGLR